MTSTTAAPRLARRKAALALALSAVSLLTVASSAGAAVYNPTTGPQLQAAVTSANANPGHDTIKLIETTYFPSAPMVITDNVTITGDHANQNLISGITVDGGNALPLEADLWTINAGVSATFEGWAQTAASNQFAAFRIKGSLRMESMLMSGNLNVGVAVAGSPATLVANNTSISDSIGDGLLVAPGGSATLNNSTVVSNFQLGIASNAGSIVRLNNSVVAYNGSLNCLRAATSQITSMSSDGTCATTFTNTDPQLGPTQAGDGGPVPTQLPQAGSPVIGAATNAICTLVDARFFVRTDGACDIGATERGAVRDSTPPSCVVTGLRGGPPAQQDVTTTDSGAASSGLGARAITDETITNGSIAFTPYTPTAQFGSSRSPLVLTATKADQGQLTRWSFTATDWAGNVKDCR